MSWNVQYLPEAKKDLESLDGSQRRLVVKAIARVSTNPLPDYEGGYGKPLGNRNNSNLAGCMKIKLKASGLRIVYKIEKIGEQMFIIVIGARADDEVYEIANSRINK